MVVLRGLVEFGCLAHRLGESADRLFPASARWAVAYPLVGPGYRSLGRPNLVNRDTRLHLQFRLSVPPCTRQTPLALPSSKTSANQFGAIDFFSACELDSWDKVEST
jgi:hypothetical protein